MLELGIGMSMIQQMPALIDGVMPKPAVPGTANGTTPPPVKHAAQGYLAIGGHLDTGNILQQVAGRAACCRQNLIDGEYLAVNLQFHL